MRWKKALERLGDTLDYSVFTKKESIYYLTGFWPTTLAALVLGRESYLAVSEMDAALADKAPIEVRVLKSFKKQLELKGRVGVEKRHTTLGFADEFLKGCELQDVKVVESMRQVKDSRELSRIKRCIQLAEKVLCEVEKTGVTEKELARQMVCGILQEGGVAFDPIVASGKSSAVPHHTPSDNPISDAGPTIIDLGARIGHYNCDMTRTFGTEKSDRFVEIYSAVAEAQKAGIESIKPGVPVKICDQAVRGVLRERGLEDYFIHSSGHGVGLEVHEAPRISRDSEEVFREGMVVSVEPGVYIPGWGGIRIEDMVYVDKSSKILTTYQK